MKVKDLRWYGFMATDQWVVFVNIMRVLTLALVAVLIYYMVANVEAIKLLAYDPCQICMNKTGATCFIRRIN